MNRSGAAMTADTSREASTSLGAPKLVDGCVDGLVGEGNVFEAAMERIVVADFGPVDSKRRVNGRLNIFGLDVARTGRRPTRPAIIQRVGAVGRGSADSPPAADTGAGK